MRPALACAALLALIAAALAAAPGASAATRECTGLQICVPIAGPWVVVPGGAAPRAHVEFELDCPRGYIVGGLDTELSSPAIDVSFAGTMGSPVNPGITTSGTAVFSATYTGGDPRAAPSFRPHIGCIPASGGGGRTPTAAAAGFPPGRPVIRRTRTVRVSPGVARVTSACASGERLIGAARAVGLYTQLPPSAVLVGAVRTQQRVQGAHTTVTVRASTLVSAARAVIQVAAVCAGGK